MTPFKLENDRQVCVGDFLFVFAFPHINACIPALAAWSIVYCDATIYFLTKSYNCFPLPQDRLWGRAVVMLQNVKNNTMQKK